MSNLEAAPPSLVEDLKAAPKDRRIVGALIAAVGAGVLFGLLLKPTLGDRPPAERGVSGRSAVTASVTDTDGLDIIVNARASDEGRIPTSTTLLDAPIQGVPPLAPLIRVSAPARPVPPPSLGGEEQLRLSDRGPVERNLEVGRCADAGSQAEAVVCADPRLAAADRRLRQAYDRALDAGASPRRLDRQQGRWLAAREDAAREDPRAVAEVYEARIAELEDMAAYPD